MAGVYIASTKPNAGKSFFSSALAVLLQKDGKKVAYMKPVGSRLKRVEAGNGDEAALIIQELIGQDYLPDEVSPVLLPQAWTQAATPIPQIRPAEALDKIKSSYAKISAGADITLVSGTGPFPTAGSIYGLDGYTIVKELGLKLILIDRFDQFLDLDSIFHCKKMLADDLLGVVINDVPEKAASLTRRDVNSYLNPNNISTLAIIPHDSRLNVVRCIQLAYELKGRIVAGNSASSQNITNFLIGTMQVESVMMHLRARPHCAVIVGGDRPDLQFAAMYGSCACLILTGNVGPNELVRAKAESTDTPIIVVKDDSFSIARCMDRILKKQSFIDLQQIRSGIELIQTSVDIEKITNAIIGAK